VRISPSSRSAGTACVGRVARPRSGFRFPPGAIRILAVSAVSSSSVRSEPQPRILARSGCEPAKLIGHGQAHLPWRGRNGHRLKIPARSGRGSASCSIAVSGPSSRRERLYPSLRPGYDGFPRRQWSHGKRRPSVDDCQAIFEPMKHVLGWDEVSPFSLLYAGLDGGDHLPGFPQQTNGVVERLGFAGVCSPAHEFLDVQIVFRREIWCHGLILPRRRAPAKPRNGARRRTGGRPHTATIHSSARPATGPPATSPLPPHPFVLCLFVSSM
jgi:hypothetical protein